MPRSFLASTAIAIAFAHSVGAQEEETKIASPPDLKLPTIPTRAAKDSHAGWWAALAAGGVTSRNGVTLRREPTPPGAEPSQLSTDVTEPVALDIEAMPKAQRGAALDAQANALAARNGGGLPPEANTRLRDLYRKTLEKAVDLRRGLSPTEGKEGKEAAASEVGRRQQGMAALLVQFLLAERDIFASSPAAAKARFGREMKAAKVSRQQRATLEREALLFLAGAPRPATPPEPTPKVGPARLSTGAIPQVASLSQMKDAALLAGRDLQVRACIVQYSRTEVTDVSDPAVTGFITRTFVATHPVTGQTWEDVGLPELLHTSIIAGLWYVEERTETITTTECRYPGAQPQTTTSTRQAYVARFAGWQIANGCAGTYAADDVLTEKEQSWFATQDAAMTYLLGATPDSDGKRCRGRYGTYPSGFYGVNWVCHQACNAFTQMKWGDHWIHYPEDFAWGSLGNLGVADSKAPCECPGTGSARHCCVPGNSCCGCSTFGRGSGWGFGLQTGWHPDKHWLDTECAFVGAGVPIAGWDETL